MANACPVLTPEQHLASEITNGAEQALMEKVHAAVAEATAKVREQLLAAGLKLPPVPAEYFESVVHQRMYLKLCGANEDTFDGGKAQTAVALIRNQQLIANHYWSADIEVTPKER